MTTFPDYPVKGETVVEESDGAYVVWTYNDSPSEWTAQKFYSSGDETFTYTDRVIDRDDSTTQQQINAEQSARVAALAAAQTNLTQNLEQAQGTKSRGIWQHHSGPLSDEGVPDENMFWMADEDGNKTQDFCEVKTVRINNTGLGEGGGGNVYLGRGEIDDQLLIQNQKSLDGCSYVITAVEGKDDYAIYGVEPDNTFCRGGVAPGEVCTVKLKKPVGTFELEGDYLPLTGGTVTGELHVNKPNNNSIFDVTAEKVEYQKHATSIEQLAPKEIINVGILDNLMRDPGKFGYLKDYLPLAGGSMTGNIAMNGHQVTGLGTPKQAGQACTKGYVDEQIAGIEIPEIPEIPDFELSTKDKLYLQGFYPFKFGEGTQINDPGEFLVKDYNYLVTQDPEKWKFLYFSTTDAYGQDLAGQFLNHMHMDAQHEGQVWICKENGYKLCGYIGKMRARDQNFERYFNLEMDNSVQLLNPPNYDTQALRVDKGEVLWIKCSFWG